MCLLCMHICVWLCVFVRVSEWKCLFFTLRVIVCVSLCKKGIIPEWGFQRNCRSENQKQVINSKILIYFILMHWNQNFANKIYTTYKDMYIHMCKNLGFKISERKRKMIRPTTKNRCVSCSSTDLSLNPLTLTFFFLLLLQF